MKESRKQDVLRSRWDRFERSWYERGIGDWEGLRIKAQIQGLIVQSFQMKMIKEQVDW